MLTHIGVSIDPRHELPPRCAWRGGIDGLQMIFRKGPVRKRAAARAIDRCRPGIVARKSLPGWNTSGLLMDWSGSAGTQ